MSVSDQETIYRHVGNGVTVTFAYGCQVLKAADLQVYLDDALTSAGFSVAGIGDLTGGTVTFTSAPANLVAVRLEREVVLERTTDYQQNGDFLSRVVNPDFNRIWMALQQHVSGLNRALKVPKSDAVGPTDLPAAADRADKLLSFDVDGNPITIALAAQSATALQMLLATILGPDHMGFNWSTAYATGTIGWAMRQMRNIRTFGNFVGDGIVDDGVVWMAAAAAGPGIIDARGVTSKCLSQINCRTGQTWLIGGAVLTFTGPANKLFNLDTISDINIIGPAKIVGDLVVNPGELVTSAAVYIRDCLRWRVSDITGINIKGSVVELVPGGSTAARGEHGTAENIVAKDCVWGWKDSPGSGAEYCTVTNMRATGCSAAGVQTSVGNTIFIGGHALDNFDGFRGLGGANNMHGIVNGMNINHNTNYQVFLDSVTNGMSFGNCHIYASNAIGGGPIYLKNSKKVVFDGGTLDAWVYNDNGGSSGLNYIKNMYCPGDYGDVKLMTTAAGLPELVVTNCFGPGASTVGVTINTSNSVHVELERQATVTQVLVTTVATTLLWPSVAMDKRAVQAAGIFTVPVGEGGCYELKGNQLFGATTFTEASCYIEVQVDVGAGYVAKDLFFPRVKFGTTLLDIAHESRLILLPGDKVRVRAVMVGTGVINHGVATWRSWVSFEKKA